VFSTIGSNNKQRIAAKFGTPYLELQIEWQVVCTCQQNLHRHRWIEETGSSLELGLLPDGLSLVLQIP